MKLKELFNSFIEHGIKSDPRGEAFVRGLLLIEQNKYADLTPEHKEDYDKDKLSNPYLDSRILNGTGEEEVKTILVGIDMETPEILLANTLKMQGKQIDLVLTHHPEGHAYATFYKVMDMQSDILNKLGMPINIAESMVGERLKEVGRKVMPQNHNRAVDAAKLLGVPFMSAHTVADNHVAVFLQSLLDSNVPGTLGDIVKMLKVIPEYADAAKNGSAPVIISGSKDSRPGKIFVDMTGGTEGPKEAIEKLANAGVGTIVGMHMSEEHLKEAKKHHVSVVIAGHISSDNLGLNLLFDQTEKKFGNLEFVACSGFRRFKRA